MSGLWVESDLRLLLAVAAGLSWLVAGLLYERRARKRKVWRYVAILAVALALGGLIARPHWNRSVDGQTAVLLTPGADSADLRSRFGELEQSSLSAALPGVASWSTQTARIPDLATWLRRHPQIEHLRIVGAGLEPWDLEDLTPTLEVLETAESEPGLRAVQWQRSLGLGDRLEVTGSFNTAGVETATLELIGPEGTCDTAEVAGKDPQHPVLFSLRCQPPGEGRFLYRLQATGPTEQLSRTELVDVQVGPANIPAVVWLEDAPSFEAKYFKQWIEAVDGRLAIRSRVSRDRYHFEYHNFDRLALRRMTPDLLGEFDLAVVEERAWNRLPEGDRSAILLEVRNAGLGLLLRMNPDRTAESVDDWPLGFRGARVATADRLLVQVEGLGAEEKEALEVGPFELHLEPGMSPRAVDKSGRVLALSRFYGAGTVGITLLDKTYPWVLAGEPGTQRLLWQKMIESLARPVHQSTWHIPRGPILVDEPLDVRLDRVASGDSLPAARFGPLEAESASLPLRHDDRQRTVWTGRVWPSATGWQ